MSTRRRPYLVAPTAPLAAADDRFRPVVEADLERLPALILEAYRGTIDDEGETLDDARAEVDHLFAGRSGPVLRQACLVAHDDEGTPSCAVLTTRWWGTPFVCFVVTDPAHRGRGLGTAALRSAAAALAEEDELGLIVTEGNPAQHLYERLGFVERPRPAASSR